MALLRVLTISVLLAALVVVGNADQALRIRDGQEVDTLSQFPSNVYITLSDTSRSCAGSILNAKWVLTSAGCIKGNVRLELSFGKQNQYNYAAGYFSISVNSDQVYVYPTNYDDLALIKLPISLVFSESVKPVSISRLSIQDLRNKFAVLPGFYNPPDSTPPPPTTTTADPKYTPDSLMYAMFTVLPNSECKQTFGSASFDEYNQLCTEGWGGNRNTACDSDIGSGLLIGWPAKSELVGLFSWYSSTCNRNKPAVFTYVAKYLPWIDSMIQG